MRMTKFNLTASLALILTIGACSVANDMDATLERQVESAAELKNQAKAPMDVATNDVIRVNDDIWLGDTSEVEYEGSPIPSYLETPDGITLISNRPITLYEIGTMINKITSISVRYDQELDSTVKQLADANKPSLQDVGAQWTNISIPRAIPPKRQSIEPTPIKYLGLSCGKYLTA